jgi:alpha-tubulin suppressor-like RCC1 family protein
LWGGNNVGQLGLGFNGNVFTPTLLTGYTNVVDASSGYTHTMFIDSNGRAFGMGSNNFGQLGDGTTSNRNIPVKVKFRNSDIIKVSAGGTHSMFLKKNGKVYVIGQNNVFIYYFNSLVWTTWIWNN